MLNNLLENPLMSVYWQLAVWYHFLTEVDAHIGARLIKISRIEERKIHVLQAIA
jgi:hypothetical protein